jgi:hypothetical protein
MKRIAPWLGAVALVLSVTPFARAQVKDPADLLPAQTLACVEVRHPDKLAREIALLVKGSALEDMPATMAKFRAKLPKDNNFWLREELGMMAMFVSPEMLAEAGRFQGAVFALTGVSKDKGPQWVIVVLSGESNFPGLILRTYLSVDDQVRSAGEAEGVTVYQEHHRVWDAVPPAPPGAPPARNEPLVVEGPAMALLPGALVFASSPDQVKDVIRRAKNKSNDPALSGLRAFRDTAKLRERPGLFAYADLEALAGQMDAAAKALTPVQRTQWDAFKTVVNPRAFRAATASLTLQNGNLELQAQVKTVPGQTSPLMALLPDKKADTQLLQYVPRDTVMSLSLGLGDGEKRWAQIVELLDAIAKNQGDSELNLPSKAIKEMQKEYGIDFGKDVAAKIKGAVVCGVAPENSWAPLCVVQATDASAAKYLAETALPTLAKIGGKEGEAPKKQQVDGFTVYTTAMPLLSRGASVSYGSHGDVLVLGLDAERVAAALKCGSKKEGLVSNAKYAAAVKEGDGSVAVGVVSVSSAVVGFFRMMELDQGPRFNKVAPPPGGPGGPPGGPPVVPKLSERGEKALKELTKIMEPLPPVVFGLNRKEDTLVLEARLTGLKTVATKLIDLWVDSALERQLERQRGFGVPGGVPPIPDAKIEEARAAEERAVERAEAAKKAAEEARREADEVRRKLEEERRKEKDKDR